MQNIEIFGIIECLEKIIIFMVSVFLEIRMVTLKLFVVLN